MSDQYTGKDLDIFRQGMNVGRRQRKSLREKRSINNKTQSSVVAFLEADARLIRAVVERESYSPAKFQRAVDDYIKYATLMLGVLNFEEAAITEMVTLMVNEVPGT